MKSRRNASFNARFDRLPNEVKQQAQATYRLFRDDPWHPGLHFKRINGNKPYWSIRIGIHFRAIGIMRDETIVWIWIGSHAEYDKLLRQL